jgi:hypothetical protein
MGLRKIFMWLFEKGYEKGYNEALRDVAQAMQDRSLEDLDWELELLRL